MGFGRINSSLGPIREVHQQVDLWLSKILENLRERIPCKEGCAYCCNQLVTLSVPEALYVVSDILKSNRGKIWINSNFHRLLRQIEFIRSLPTDLKLEDYQRKWYEAAIPCIFLNHFKRCIVYAKRPAVCRSYFVLGDANLCAGSVDTKIEHLQTAPVIALLAQSSQRVADEFRVPNMLLPLPVAVHMAFIAYKDGLGELRNAFRRARLVKIPVKE